MRGPDKRVRYWGFIGNVLPPAVDPALPPAEHTRAVSKARADIELMAQRIHDLGFNSVRNWHPHWTDHYTPGDGSYEDLVAYYFAQLDKRGIKIWESGLNELGDISADDVNVIDDPRTAKAWTHAMTQIVKENHGKPFTLRCGFGSYPQIMRFWDPRYEALVIKRMKKAAQWPNRYKQGLRLSDDPQIIVWELSNEELAYKGFFSGSWQRLPSFLRNQLLTKWTDFLRAKYGADRTLNAAWKYLLPGESLAKGTVMLAPLANPTPGNLAINDVNPVAVRALKFAAQTYTRDDFSRQRGEDVVEFFTSMIVQHKQRLTAALKKWGRSCAFSPTLWDASNCFQIQSSYMFQQSEAVATCSYIQGMAHDPTCKRWPFYSGLETSPRMCWDVPWMEQSSIENKPHFIYEFQIGCRTKYRAEAATRVAALGSIQDWDIINWHIYGNYDLSGDTARENPFDGMLHIWHDYFGFANDEVQNSAMKAAAEVFKRRLVEPAPSPTTFVFGRRTLLDPKSMDYGRSYGDYARKFIPTCYRYGARVRIDVDRENDQILGLSYEQGVYEVNPVRPNDQIEYDWQQGHLLLDASAVASYTGFYGQRQGRPVTFRNGVEFSDVVIVNPRNMPYPVTPEEGYVALQLVSADGKPLSKTNRALLSAVSTSFNTGYHVDTSKASNGLHLNGPQNRPPSEYFGAWCEPGTAPVLVARVGVTVKCPAIDGMEFTLRDWHMRPIGSGLVKRGMMRAPEKPPVFVVELTR